MNIFTILLIILLVVVFFIVSLYLFTTNSLFAKLSIKSAIDNMSAGMYIRYIYGDIMRYDIFNSMAKIFYNMENVTDSKYWDQDEEDKYDEMTIAQDAPVCFEKHICDEQGNSLRWLDVVKRKNEDNRGGYIITTTLIDITHRKESEKQLVERNQKITLALKTSNMVAWDYDVVKNMFYSNNEIICSSLDSVCFTSQDYYNATHPEDIEEMSKYVKLMEEGEDITFSFNARIMNPNDLTWMYTCVSGAPLTKDESGKVLKYTGFRSDQSDLIIAKRKTHDINNLLVTLINKIPCIMCLKDIDNDFRYLMVNEYFVINIKYQKMI